MRFFIDSADIQEIQKLAETGFVDGVTTNPSLIAKTGRKIKDVIREICHSVPGPISAEVTATDYNTMMKEAEALTAIAENVVIKVPLTIEGLKACRALTDQGVTVNVTLCFSANQALLAAKAGAAYISPFVGRLDDAGHDGIQVVEEIITLYDNYPDIDTEVLFASTRTTNHISHAAQMGVDVITIPPKLLWQMYSHPLTDKGLAAFLEDWKQTGQSIL